MKISLKGIIAVSGKPGLYKILAQGNNNVIVESLVDHKRFPVHSSSKISTLEDITMYTTGEEDKPLKAVLQAIYDKENGGPCIDAKEETRHAAYLSEVFPDYDKERVYASDIRKLFAWYNLLQSSGELIKLAQEAEEAEQKTAEEEKEKEKAEQEKQKRITESEASNKKADKKPEIKKPVKKEAVKEKPEPEKEKKEKKATVDKKKKTTPKKTTASAKTEKKKTTTEKNKSGAKKSKGKSKRG